MDNGPVVLSEGRLVIRDNEIIGYNKNGTILLRMSFDSYKQLIYQGVNIIIGGESFASWDILRKLQEESGMPKTE